METVRLTTAQAIVEWLVNQHTVVDGEEVPIFAGAFGTEAPASRHMSGAAEVCSQRR